MQHLISEKKIPDDEYAPDPKLTEHLFPFKNVFIASAYHFFSNCYAAGCRIKPGMTQGIIVFYKSAITNRTLLRPLREALIIPPSLLVVADYYDTVSSAKALRHGQAPMVSPCARWASIAELDIYIVFVPL